MDQNNRFAIGLLNISKKRDNQLPFFRGQLDVFQYNFGDPVHAGEKMRAVAFAGAVEVQNIAAVFGHTGF